MSSWSPGSPSDTRAARVGSSLGRRGGRAEACQRLSLLFGGHCSGLDSSPRCTLLLRCCLAVPGCGPRFLQSLPWMPASSGSPVLPVPCSALSRIQFQPFVLRPPACRQPRAHLPRLLLGRRRGGPPNSAHLSGASTLAISVYI